MFQDEVTKLACAVADVSVDDQYPKRPTFQFALNARRPAAVRTFASSANSLLLGINQSEYPVLLEELKESTLATAPPRHAAFAKLVLVSPQPMPKFVAPTFRLWLEQ